MRHSKVPHPEAVTGAPGTRSRGSQRPLALSPRSDAPPPPAPPTFLPAWWDALRAALPKDSSGEAMLVADRQQNVYGVKPWTELDMNGAAFRSLWGTLESSHRMSPALCRLATDFMDRFQPDVDEHRPIPAQGEFEFRTDLRRLQIEPTEPGAAACIGVTPCEARSHSFCRRGRLRSQSTGRRKCPRRHHRQVSQYADSPKWDWKTAREQTSATDRWPGADGRRRDEGLPGRGVGDRAAAGQT
jgi:hypothetical protein